MSKDGKFRVDKFNGQNYQLWKMQMEHYLYQKDLFLPLDGVEKNPTAMKDEEWEILDRKSLGMIRLSLVVSVAFNILKEKTMKDLMDTLAKLYEKTSVSNQVLALGYERKRRTRKKRGKSSFARDTVTVMLMFNPLL
jgi:hypothetical protein